MESLTTDRLSLQPLALTDSDFIQTLVNTEGWLKFIGNRNVNSGEEARAYVQKILQSKSVSYWIVSLKSNQVPIGIVTFIKRDYLEHPDIGFAFLPDFSKNGYAFEAANAALNALLAEQKLTHVLATTIRENVSSIKLLKKMGFEFEREVQVEKEKLHVYGLTRTTLT